jgi:hypothetical protein
MKNNCSGLVLPCVMLSSIIIICLVTAMYGDLIDFLHTSQISLHSSRRYQENQNESLLPDFNTTKLNDKFCLSSENQIQNQYENCFIISYDYPFFDSSNQISAQVLNCQNKKNQNSYILSNGMEAEETCEITELQLEENSKIESNLILTTISNNSANQILEVNGFLKINELILQESLTIISAGSIEIENLSSQKPNLDLSLISATGSIDIKNSDSQNSFTCYAKQSIKLPDFQSYQAFGDERTNLNYFVQSWQRYREN